MSRNIVFEGWLTKSPPNRRIWRTVSSTLAWHFTFVDRRWRRRWFALRQSGELPGQYFLDYYADRNCRRLKGTIDLDLCEQIQDKKTSPIQLLRGVRQGDMISPKLFTIALEDVFEALDCIVQGINVDAGLHMERHGQAPLNPNLRGSVFTIQTQRRTYHLEAECEAEMEKWVDAICRVCGLRATEDTPPITTTRHNVLDMYQNNLAAIAAMNDHYECVDGTGPYIPISECITGVRAQDEQRHFTFEPKTIAMGARNEGQQYTSQPHIRINSELSENDSNLSDEDDGSLHASHQNLHWEVTKSFTKLSVAPNNHGVEDGPPVPPRPPKTFTQRSREVPVKDPFQGPKIQEPVEVHDNSQYSQQRLRVPRRMSQGAPSSPRQLLIPVVRCPEEEEEFSPGHASMQYCNLPSLPPAVDRNLKPRHSSHSIGHINAIMGQGLYYTEVRFCRLDNICKCERCIWHRHHLALTAATLANASLCDLPPCPNTLPRPLVRRPQSSLAQRPLPPLPHQPHYTNVRVPIEPTLPGLAPIYERPELDDAPIYESVPQVPTHHSAPESLAQNTSGGLRLGHGEEKSDVLQYLDLDLHTAKPPPAKGPERKKPRKKVETAHGKSVSNVDTDAYKTVDFLKTEAFNITRQDAEASRSFQY